jgi:hypothetical protein
MSVMLTNVQSIQMGLTLGATVFKMSQARTSPAKGVKPGKLLVHEANLVDINPVETPNTHACLLKPINESDLSRDNLQEAYMLDLFNKVLGTPSNNMTDLLSKKVPKKTQATNNQTGTSFDSIQVLVSLDESVTHHLDELSLTADQQATNCKVLCDEFLHMFVDELYSTGYCDIKLNISNCNIRPLKLQSTSLAIVSFIQQTKVKSLLKVLFDSRSDKTIFKRSSLPQGIAPSTGKKQKVSGMNASSVKMFCSQTLLFQSSCLHNAFQAQFVL